MVSIDCVERGLARYIDEAFLPAVTKDNLKGFAVGAAATLFIKRGGHVLRELIKNPLLQQMGVVSPDGSVDLDLLREIALANVPPTGMIANAPMGITIRISPADVTAIYESIKKEASL